MIMLKAFKLFLQSEYFIIWDFELKLNYFSTKDRNLSFKNKLTIILMVLYQSIILQ